MVGNVLIDTLQRELKFAKNLNMAESLGISQKNSALLGMHRPSNIDEPGVLRKLLDLFRNSVETLPWCFLFILVPASLRIGRPCRSSGLMQWMDHHDPVLLPCES